MFENIEEYYIVRISNLENQNYGKGNNVQNIDYKFACVKKKKDYYCDLITNERYKYGMDLFEENQTSFIDSDYSLIPLTEFINVSDSQMIKEQLIKLVIIILDELNEKLLTSEEKIQKQR